MYSQEKFDALAKVLEHFYKSRHKSFLKASDFYLPFFFGRKKRIAEFEVEYKPFVVACFMEQLRSVSLRMYGRVDEAMMEAFLKKYVTLSVRPYYDRYWDLICNENEKNPNPKDMRPLNSDLTTLFMYQLFGPDATEPNPDILDSQRHIVAVEFQVGTLLFELNHGVKVVLERFKHNKKKSQTANPASEKADTKA